MSDALNCDALSWAEIDGQEIELLPARTVLSTFGDACHGGHYDNGGDGGDAGEGGDATVVGYNYGNGIQINIAIGGPGGDGGDANGGDADGGDADGGDGGD